MSVLTVFAGLPIIWIVVELLFHKTNHSTLRASIRTLLLTIILAMMIWNMPMKDIVMASVEGGIMSLWPISTVIVAAVFLYNICEYSGNMKYIRETLSSASSDKKILVLLVVWGFGSFIEGIAGFGTSIAVVSSMLLALGFPPFLAALLAIVANPVSSVFGSMGVQMPTLSKVTGLSVEDLAISSTYIVIPIVFATPFLLIFIMKKEYCIKSSRDNVWGIASAGAVSFAVAMYLTVKYINTDLTGVLGAIMSLVTMFVLVWLRNKDYRDRMVELKSNIYRQQIIAWLPFILCVFLIIMASKLVAPIYEILSNFKMIFKVTVGNQTSEYTINFLTVAVPWIFFSAFIGGIVQGIPLKQCFKILYKTVCQMSRTILTLVVLLSISRIMTYSGMMKEIALAFVDLMGDWYVFAVPVLGSIGAFITGSATSSNVLLGDLQITAADALNKNPAIIMGFSIVGGTIGKMISPQNIAIGMSAAKIAGQDGIMFKKLIKYYFFYMTILAGMSILIYLYEL